MATRSSMRLKESIEGSNDETCIVDTDGGDESKLDSISNENIPEEKLSSSVLPEESDQLDDHEFQVYASLRAWRLRRSKELEIEPYKVCRNRTLCEIIRRKRNEAVFASRTKNGNIAEQDLLSVWGVGPSKAAPGGFGWEMLDVLDSDKCVDLLELSRSAAGYPPAVLEKYD